MIVHIGSDVYEVVFSYHESFDTLGHHNRYTFCDLYKNRPKEDKKFESTFHGSAMCAEHDQFVKETGRKISLTRALRESGFTRDERVVFWHTYLNRNVVKCCDTCGDDACAAKDRERYPPQDMSKLCGGGWKPK